MRFDIRPAAVPSVVALHVAAGISHNQLTWEAFGWRVAVYCSTTNDRTTATRIGETSSNVFTHTLGGVSDRYYWVRGIDTKGRENGVWNPTSAVAGLRATSRLTVELDTLSQKLAINGKKIEGIDTSTGKITADEISANVVYSGTTLATRAYIDGLFVNYVYAGDIAAERVTSGTLSSVNINIGDGKFTVDATTGLVKAKNFVGYGVTFTNEGNTTSYALRSSSGGAGPALELVGGTGYALDVIGKSAFQNKASFYGDVWIQGTLTATVSYATSAGSAGSCSGNADTATSANTAHRLDHTGDVIINNGNYNTRLQASDGNLVTYVGTGTGTSIWSAHYGWTSDRKYKERIVDTSVNGVSVIGSLSVRDFFWKEDFPLCDGLKHMGFIAQELQMAIPSAVGDVNGTLMINNAAVVPYLVKAVQELAAKVAVLESAQRQANI